MKYLQTFTQLNESHNVKSVSDVEKLKQLLGLLNNSFEESKNFAKRGVVNPQKEFEGFFNALKRTRQALMDFKLESFSPHFINLVGAVNAIMNVRDMREAAEIRNKIHKLFSLVQQDFNGLISKIHREIKTYVDKEGEESQSKR
jgi:molecular chaperone GrpE (heat shock protein)